MQEIVFLLVNIWNKLFKENKYDVEERKFYLIDIARSFQSYTYHN